MGQKGYQALIKVMNKHAQALIILYKRLQSASEAFPLLSFKCLMDWVKQLSIVNEAYTAVQFTKDFEELKVVEKKRPAPQRRRGSLARAATVTSLKSSLSLGSSLGRGKKG